MRLFAIIDIELLREAAYSVPYVLLYPALIKSKHLLNFVLFALAGGGLL